MAEPAARSLDQLTLGDDFKLEELVDKNALAEMVHSFYELFRVPLRIYSQPEGLLADASQQPELYRYLNTLTHARRALQQVVSEVKSLRPEREGLYYECITGAEYYVVSIRYDGRAIGRMVLGPYLPATLTEIPRTLAELDPELDVTKVRELLPKMARAKQSTVQQIALHLSRTLDLILFSGHRALLTSNMHMASVRENFRELQEKNNKLQQAYDRLKELDRLKSNFLATVSHELRTPLTSIIGYSEMLSEGIAGPLVDEQKEFVQTIHSKGEQLLDLIKGLLDLSKLESGTMSLRRKNTRVEPVVRDVVGTVTPAALKKDVELKVALEAGLLEMWADAERIRQVLLNLTENAIKFTPSGGTVTLSARLATMQTDASDEGGVVILNTNRAAIEFRIADTGIGIPESERERVFDAFYQVDSSSTREQGGTGLGLSIVKRLVESHDGQVRVEANEPAGVVFVVLIPIRRATFA